MEMLFIFLLILLNGFFSMSEIAIVSFKKIRIDRYGHKNPKSVKMALQLQDNQEDFLASIQVCITLISLINGFIGGSALGKYIAPLFVWMNMSATAAMGTAITISILIVTFFTIILGELVPKSIGLSNPEKVSVRIAYTIYIFSKIFHPIVRLLSLTTSLFNKMLGIHKADSQITEEELRDIIKEAGESDVIEEEQSELHENIFYFADKRAKHIMIHRSEIEWIDINLPEDEFTKQLYDFKSSKILVCNKHLENFIGVLNVKEYYINKLKQTAFKLEDILYQPLIFTETTEAQDILTAFREAQKYIGIVYDEFGELEGIITLHDIIENIVGEMPEEKEIVEPDIYVREDNSILVNGDAPVEMLTDIIDGFEIDFEEVDYSTVAGFVLENIEKAPEIGDNFEFLGYKLEVVDIDHNRIDKVLITKRS